MNVREKLELFHTLVDIGVKEIEVGFPSASETEYEFIRTLIEGGHIPDDVTIQVLVQAREHLIRRTFEAIDGAKHVIFHFYNSTSTLQRKVVFHTDVEGVKKIAVDAARLIRELSQPAHRGAGKAMDGVQVAAEDQVRTCPQAAVFQYSPIAIQPQGVDHSQVASSEAEPEGLRRCAFPSGHGHKTRRCEWGTIQLEVLEKTAATARRSSLVGALSSVP